MQNKKLQFISAWKTELVSSAIVVLCLALVYLFPTSGALQNITKNLFFLILLPGLYIKFILKKDLSDYGFNLQNKKIGLWWALGMLAASFLAILLLLRFYHFENNYLIPAYIANNFWIFIFYELVLVNLLLFINEFFFKGFLLFTFSEKLGIWTILIQFLVYVLFLLSAGSLNWQLTPMILISLLGGIVTYKSRSFLYSYAASLLFLLFLDAYVIYIFK